MGKSYRCTHFGLFVRGKLNREDGETNRITLRHGTADVIPYLYKEGQIAVSGTKVRVKIKKCQVEINHNLIRMETVVIYY